MVIMTAKVPKRKVLVIALVVLAAVLVLTLCLHGAKSGANSPEQADAQGKTNESRIAFLAGFGWQVEPEPVQTQQVRVPEDPSEVFLRYNDLQQSQGYDLLSYSGKTLTRYVYQITNYPGSDGVYFATLLIYNDSVVGGDVASSRQNGVMHGFSMPAAQPSSGAFLPESPESEEISENLS